MYKFIFCCIFVGIFSVQLQASTYTGKITYLSISAGETPARISIRVTPHGSECSGFGGLYFSYENADAGIGKIWTSALLAAYAAQKDVLIAGTGTCDVYNIEKVLHIDLQ